jgi:hypothetical protein
MGGGVLRAVDPARNRGLVGSDGNGGKGAWRWWPPTGGLTGLTGMAVLGGGLAGLAGLAGLRRLYKARTAPVHPGRKKTPVVEVKSGTDLDVRHGAAQVTLRALNDTQREAHVEGHEKRGALAAWFKDMFRKNATHAETEDVRRHVVFDTTGSRNGSIGLLVSPTPLRAYAYLEQESPEVVARAFYTGFEQSESLADTWRITVCVEPAQVDQQRPLERYKAAFTAAARVVCYRHGEWAQSRESRESRVSQSPQSPNETAARVATQNAVIVCEQLAKRGVGVGIVCFSVDPGAGAASHFNDGKPILTTVEDAGHIHTTHEAAVVSAWLRGECGTPKEQNAKVAQSCIKRLFEATIARQWGSRETPERFCDAWVVRNATLDTTSSILPTDTRSAATSTTATLVFVTLDETAVRLEGAMRAGLDAMIVEGATVAILTIPTISGKYAMKFAITPAGFQLLLTRVLNEPPRDPRPLQPPKAPVPPGLITNSEVVTEFTEFGMEDEPADRQFRMHRQMAEQVLEAKALDGTKIPKTRREYFSLIVVSTYPHAQSRFGNQARFV